MHMNTRWCVRVGRDENTVLICKLTQSLQELEKRRIAREKEKEQNRLETAEMEMPDPQKIEVEVERRRRHEEKLVRRHLSM